MATSTLNILVDKLQSRKALERAEAVEAARGLTDGDVPASLKKAFLIALSEKGETPSEVAAFAAFFRSVARDPGLNDFADRAIDIVGTGGDKSGSFNISTAASFIVAAAGIPVFKHGNRSVTSSCGTADLLAALGVNLEADNPTLRASLQELNFTFLFAPAFHPAFKEIMPVRKALAAGGHRTVFNILGPLINPGKPAHQLMGVYAAHWVEPLAEVLDALELKSGLLVHCSLDEQRGLDELSVAGQNRIAGAGRLRSRRGVLDLEETGLPAGEIGSLAGGDVNRNLEILEQLLNGAAPAALVDSVALNAGAAFWIVGKVNTLESGVREARALLESGAVHTWLGRVKSFYAA